MVIILTRKGFSLIELMVVVGVMSVSVLGIMSMMDNQNKKINFLTEKFEIQDTKTILSGLVGENSFCTCLLGGKTMDTVTGVLNPGIASVPLSFTNPGCTPSALKIIPSVGSKLSDSSNIEIASVKILPATEVVTGTGKYLAQLEVKFSNTIRSTRPLTVPVFYKIDSLAGDPTARPFLTCESL